MVRLRGGRGPKVDQQTQNEFLAERAKDSQGDNIGPWFYSLTPLYTPRTTSSGIATNSMRFYYCPPVETPMTLAAFRATVTAISAGSETELAFYLYNKKLGTLDQIPASYVKFDTSATGLQTIPFRRPFRITPRQRLFLGVKALGNACTIGGVTGSDGVPVYAILSAATDVLPGRTLVGPLIRGQTHTVPAIVFLSPEAYLLM